MNSNALIASTLAASGVVILMASWSYYRQYEFGEEWRIASGGWLVLLAGTAAAAVCIGLAVWLLTAVK